MRKWLYRGSDPGVLADLNLLLQPGQEFEAPDDWEPSPSPHPVYRPVESAQPKSPPAVAAPEE